MRSWCRSSILGLLYLILRSHPVRPVDAGDDAEPDVRAAARDRPRAGRALGFGISVATATAAGAVYGIVFPFNPGSHYDLISRLLTIIVLGGLGSLAGAVVAALFMGVGEAVLSVEISPTWASLTFFLLLIAVLHHPAAGAVRPRERGAL